MSGKITVVTCPFLGWTEETEQVLVERNVDATPPPRRRLPPTRMVPQGDYYDDNVR